MSYCLISDPFKGKEYDIEAERNAQAIPANMPNLMKLVCQLITDKNNFSTSDIYASCLNFSTVCEIFGQYVKYCSQRLTSKG